MFLYYILCVHTGHEHLLAFTAALLLTDSSQSQCIEFLKRLTMFVNSISSAHKADMLRGCRNMFQKFEQLVLFGNMNMLTYCFLKRMCPFLYCVTLILLKYFRL